MNLKVTFYAGIIIMIIFFVSQSLVVFGVIPCSTNMLYFGYGCFLSFLPIAYVIIKNRINFSKHIEYLNKYSKKLNRTLISQSHNSLFYEGNVVEGAKLLTYEVINSLNTDRCSIWLYNKNKTSIICQQLYIKSEEKWYQDIEIHKKDYKPYFEALETNPIIVAHDVTTHPATSCFTETYSIPLGVKSMLDVPIIYKGKTIGVICIESLTPRQWIKPEIDFAELLSSLYSFALSVKEDNSSHKKLIDFENFVDSSVLISKANKSGKITYVNKRFTDISGWSLEEVLGKDHNIVNSGEHPPQFWKDMYKTVVKDKKIWNAVVTNKAKDGTLYYVDTFIKANFTNNDKLKEYISIRQDVTEIYNTLNEINQKNTYLEHSAKILRHDMHSGINTYIPRGITSLERRLNDDVIKKLKLEAPLKMIKEGLKHTQKVYKGVYEFTNLVKKDSILSTEMLNLKDILVSFLSSTAYSSQVSIDTLPTINVNEALFCTAIDNLIRNGLKYNDSESKIVSIFMDNDDVLIIQDNGRGMTQQEFEALSKPYVRKQDQKESGSGLGLNICIAILKEHGFGISCEKNDIGTKIKIKLK